MPRLCCIPSPRRERAGGVGGRVGWAAVTSPPSSCPWGHRCARPSTASRTPSPGTAGTSCARRPPRPRRAPPPMSRRALGALPVSPPGASSPIPECSRWVPCSCHRGGLARRAARRSPLGVAHRPRRRGACAPVTTDASGLWHAFRDARHGAGLGTGARLGSPPGRAGGPHLARRAAARTRRQQVQCRRHRRLAALPHPGAVGLTAYLAGRVVTSSRVARGIAALAWGTSAVVTSATADGRLTLAVGHVVLPLVLAGLTLAARRDGTWTATFATALAAAVLGAFVPPPARRRAPRRPSCCSSSAPAWRGGARSCSCSCRWACSVRGSPGSPTTGVCCSRARACSPRATVPAPGRCC